MEGVMEFTSDLVDCVNNDTKDSIADALGGTTSPLETSITIEEKEEDEEKEEEIMKLFWTPCILPPPMKLSKKRRRTTSESEDIKPLAKFDSKALKRDQKRMGKEDNNKGYHVHKGLKMLNSTLDAEDIFDDWNWNLEEEERLEDIFSEWLWNFQPQVDLRQKFYNDPMTEDAWNDFYFWRFDTSPCIDSIDTLASNDKEATMIPESYGHAQELMKEGRRDHKWLGTDNCKYWEGNYQNEAILNSLLHDEIQEKEKEGTFSEIFSPKRTSPRSQSYAAKTEVGKESAPQYLSFFWDESASNQATIELLMKHEEMEKQSTSIWEEKDIVFAHPSPHPSMSSKLLIEVQQQQVEKPSTQYFPWEDPDTVAGLLEVDHHSRRPSSDSVFLWDDPAAIGMLLTDEEEDALLAREDKTDMTEELLPDWENSCRKEWEDREWEKQQTWPREEKGKKKREHQYTTWEQWSLWDQFGSTGEIIQAYEEITAEKPRRSKMDWNGLEVNVSDAFWNITLSASSQDSGLDIPMRNKTIRQTRPDPINTFKAFRHIFNEAENPKTNERKEEVEDIYSDWAASVLYLEDLEVEDIYADWASNVLDDERMEKKRSKRGRGPARGRHPFVGPIGHQTSQEITQRRPGTPTVAVKKVKGWDADLGWIDSKIPKKERKSSQAWRNGRRQRQLHSKSHAKQPRTNSVFSAKK